MSDATDLIRVLKVIDNDPQRYRRPPEAATRLRRSAEQGDELADLYNAIVNTRELRDGVGSVPIEAVERA